jgi:acetyl-CoA C-acetyltransferase
VPADRRVYLRGWGGANDPVLVAEHPDLARSPAMAVASSVALEMAGAGIDDVAHLDLYSCFPSSLHFAADALGIDPTDARGLTVTGGLAYHGGPASGYLTHSIAAMVERLRHDPGALGLVSGVGMHMTKHVFGVYSTEPGRLGSGTRALPPAEKVPVVATHAGPATVAAYSVVHERDGSATRAVLICDVPGGARTYATTSETAVCRSAEERELVGARVQLEPVEVDGAFGPASVNRATRRD